MPQTTPVLDDHEESLMDFDVLEVCNACESGTAAPVRAVADQEPRVAGGVQEPGGAPERTTLVLDDYGTGVVHRLEDCEHGLCMSAVEL